MLIVALQDDVDSLYAIWNTVSDRFLGVNLNKYEAVGIIMDYKGNYTFEEALAVYTLTASPRLKQGFPIFSQL